MSANVTTGLDLKIWRGALGLSAREAAAQLGISKNTIARYEGAEDQPVPRQTGLAMSAIYHRLHPWT